MNREEKMSDNQDVRARVTRRGTPDMQVCVPADWDDAKIKKFADSNNICGTSGGWHIRREGNPALGGDPERTLCHSYSGFVHIMLDS